MAVSETPWPGGRPTPPRPGYLGGLVQGESSSEEEEPHAGAWNVGLEQTKDVQSAGRGIQWEQELPGGPDGARSRTPSSGCTTTGPWHRLGFWHGVQETLAPGPRQLDTGLSWEEWRQLQHRPQGR